MNVSLLLKVQNFRFLLGTKSKKFFINKTNLKLLNQKFTFWFTTDVLPKSPKGIWGVEKKVTNCKLELQRRKAFEIRRNDALKRKK